MGSFMFRSDLYAASEWRTTSGGAVMNISILFS